MKRIPIVLLAIAAILPAFGAGPGDSRPVLPVLVGALKGPSGIGMVYLFENPPVLPENVQASYAAVASADIMAAKVMSGEMDMAVLPVNMAAKLYVSGLPYRAVAVVGDGMVKLLSTDASIRTLADLKGREVYVAGQAATPDYVLRTVLRKNGMNPDTDLSLVYSMPYPEMAAGIPRSAYVFQTAPAARARIEALLSVFLAADPKSVGGKLPDDGFYAEAGVK